MESPEWMYDAKLWSGCANTNAIHLERCTGEGDWATRLGRFHLCTHPAPSDPECKRTVPWQCWPPPERLGWRTLGGPGQASNYNEEGEGGGMMDGKPSVCWMLPEGHAQNTLGMSAYLHTHTIRSHSLHSLTYSPHPSTMCPHSCMINVNMMVCLSDHNQFALQPDFMNT